METREPVVRAIRSVLYVCLDRRGDALFELADAAMHRRAGQVAARVQALDRGVEALFKLIDSRIDEQVKARVVGVGCCWRRCCTAAMAFPPPTCSSQSCG